MSHVPSESMHLHNETGNESGESQAGLEAELTQRQNLTVTNARLQIIQKCYGFAAVFIPLLGSLIGIVLLKPSIISLLDVGILILMYALTIIGITVGFHRQLAHRAFQTTPFIRGLLAILGSAAAQGHVLHWVSNHRRHHQCSDRAGDPHSPHLDQDGKPLNQIRGLWHAQVSWMFGGEFPNVLLAKDLLRDPLILRINRLYLVWVLLGFAIPAALEGIVTFSWSGVLHGVVWGGFVRVFLVHHAISSVNSITHLYGHRPFLTAEQSTNNAWFVIPTGGEAWHNNHHAFPNSAQFGLKWWQIDWGYWVIYLLERINLAWDVKRPTLTSLQTKKAG
jgi:stearoyl-CoA desaturase (Delta-9 desaturase)